MLRIACSTLALTQLLTAQTVCWAEGPTAQDLTVRAFAAGSARVLMRGVSLLDLELTNRTAQNELRTDVARRLTRQGLTRIVLPDNGALFRYVRDGGRLHGLLHVDSTGRPNVVLERPAIGAAAPFESTVAVAPDGLHAAVLDSVNGLELTIVRLDGSVYASTGTASRSIRTATEVELETLCVGRRVAWFATDAEKVWRLGLGDGAAAADITSGPASGVRVKSEFAPSADGRAVVFLRGPKDLYSLYIARESGAAIRLSAPAAKYEEPGYLPAFVGGPRLLLNDDASTLFYIDSTIRDEAFLMDVSGARPTTEVTGNANFQPYIGVVVLPCFFGSTLLSAIGDPGLFDIYASSTRSPLVENLTQTANNTTRPWATGGLVLSAIGVTSNQRPLLRLEPATGGARSVWRMDPAGPTLLASAATRLDRAEAAGGRGTWRIRSSLGDVLLNDAGDPLLRVPPGVELSTALDGGSWRTFFVSLGSARSLVVELLGSRSLIAVPLSSPTDELVTAGPDALALDGADLLLLDSSGVHKLAGGAAHRWILSGHGVSN